MNRAGMAIVVGTLFSVNAAVLAQSGAQGGARASAATSTQVGNTQAQASGSAAANTTTPAQGGQDVALSSGTAFNAELTSPVDSKKAKSGDTVTAYSTEAVKQNGKTLIPRGAKLIGHVTEATAKAKGDANSALAIQFDKATLKDDTQIPLNVMIQAIASAEMAPSVAGAGPDAMGGGSAQIMGSARGPAPGTLGGVHSTAGGAVGAVTNTAANAGNTAGGTVNAAAHTVTGASTAANTTIGGLNAQGQLTSNSRGVFGMNDLSLNPVGTSNTQGSVITSAGKNVHLDSGTRLLLVSQAATSPHQ